MKLAEELENDLVLAFLVEKKYSGKLDATEVLALINNINKALQPISLKEIPGETAVGAYESAQAARS